MSLKIIIHVNSHMEHNLGISMSTLSTLIIYVAQQKTIVNNVIVIFPSTVRPPVPSSKERTILEIAFRRSKYLLRKRTSRKGY